MSQNLVSLVLKLFTQQDDRVIVYTKNNHHVFHQGRIYFFISLEYSFWHSFCKRTQNLSLKLVVAYMYISCAAP